MMRVAFYSGLESGALPFEPPDTKRDELIKGAVQDVLKDWADGA